MRVVAMAIVMGIFCNLFKFLMVCTEAFIDVFHLCKPIAKTNYLVHLLVIALLSQGRLQGSLYLMMQFVFF